MRKAEARKITRPTVSAVDERASREMGRKLEIARRRVAEMVEAAMWPPAKGWADDLWRLNYVAPQVSISLGNMAETVREGRLRADCARQRFLNLPGANSVYRTVD